MRSCHRGEGPFLGSLPPDGFEYLAPAPSASSVQFRAPVPIRTKDGLASPHLHLSLTQLTVLTVSTLCDRLSPAKLASSASLDLIWPPSNDQAQTAPLCACATLKEASGDLDRMCGKSPLQPDCACMPRLLSAEG